MAKANLSSMNVDELMALRTRVDEMLVERRAKIQKQLETMDRAIAVPGGERVGRRGAKGKHIER